MQNENLIKGQFIELLVQLELTRYGFDISIPNYNSSRYDLIADTGKELLRIQIKKSISNSKQSFTFQCTSQNVRSKSQTGKHRYTANEIDYFATAWLDKVYLVPVDETSTQKTIKIDDDTYLASNVLKSYFRISDEEIFNESHKGKFYCDNCGCEISSNRNLCNACASFKNRKVDRPTREELKNLIRTFPFTTIAAQFGVSDNAIRKWCDAENLPRKKGDIKEISDERWRNV